MVATCPNCRKEVEQGAVFCGFCGTALSSSPRVENKRLKSLYRGETSEKRRPMLVIGVVIIALTGVADLLNGVLSFINPGSADYAVFSVILLGLVVLYGASKIYGNNSEWRIGVLLVSIFMIAITLVGDVTYGYVFPIITIVGVIMSYL